MSEWRYSQTSPGCLRLSMREYQSFIALLTLRQLHAMLASSDGMLRAVASWRYYYGRG